VSKHLAVIEHRLAGGGGGGIGSVNPCLPPSCSPSQRSGARQALNT